MGAEVLCTVHYQRRTSEGRALLESEALLFRGGFRLTIPLATVRSVEGSRGRLVVTFPGGVATFELGPRAERWAQNIRAPKRLVDKLGVKANSRVVVLGVENAEFWAQLDVVRAVVAKGKLRRGSDVIFLGAKTARDLRRLQHLQEYLRPGGAIWVVAPRGAEPSERKVLTAGRSAGLVDTKVVRFSDTHTAHKFMIPLARRKLGETLQRPLSPFRGGRRTRRSIV